MKKIGHNFQIMCKNTLLEYNGEHYETKDKPDEDYINIQMGFNYISSNKDSLNYGYKEGEYRTRRHAVCHHLMPLFDVSEGNDSDANEEESLRRLDFALSVFGYTFSPKREKNIFLIMGEKETGKSLLWNWILGKIHHNIDTNHQLVECIDDWNEGKKIRLFICKIATNIQTLKLKLYRDPDRVMNIKCPIIICSGIPPVEFEELIDWIIPIVMTNVLDSFDTARTLEFFEDERNLEVLFNMCIEAFERVFLSNSYTFEGKIPQDWTFKRDEIKVKKSKR